MTLLKNIYKVIYAIGAVITVLVEWVVEKIRGIR